jgi:AraC-like DNA-binding protein
MSNKNIIDFLSSDKDFYITKILKQHWKQDMFSYMHTPRPDYGLILLIRGEIRFMYDESSVIAKAGDLVFLPKNLRYDAIFENTSDDYLINFDVKEDFQIFSNPEILFGNAPFYCYEIYSSLVEESLIKSIYSAKCKGLFYLLIDDVINNSLISIKSEQKIIDKIKNLLIIDEELSIPQIAKECNLSESGLRKKFLFNTNISPIEYRLNHKLTKAKYYLESTDMSISEIAEKLSFYDSAYFCKIFKKHMGISPRQYARLKKI